MHYVLGRFFSRIDGSNFGFGISKSEFLAILWKILFPVLGSLNDFHKIEVGVLFLQARAKIRMRNRNRLHSWRCQRELWKVEKATYPSLGSINATLETCIPDSIGKIPPSGVLGDTGTHFLTCTNRMSTVIPTQCEQFTPFCENFKVAESESNSKKRRSNAY
jgi:hypothetical protein